MSATVKAIKLFQMTKESVFELNLFRNFQDLKFLFRPFIRWQLSRHKIINQWNCFIRNSARKFILNSCSGTDNVWNVIYFQGRFKFNLQGRCSSTTALRQSERVSSSPARRFRCITLHVLGCSPTSIAMRIQATTTQQIATLYVSLSCARFVECESTPCFPWQRKLLSLFTGLPHTPPTGNDNKSFQRTSETSSRFFTPNPGDSRRSHRSEKLKVDSEKRRSFFATHSTFQGGVAGLAP